MNDKDQQKLLNLLLALFALWVVWKLVTHSHNSIVEGMTFGDFGTKGEPITKKDAEDYYGEDYDEGAFDDADENEDESISGTEFDDYISNMAQGGDDEEDEEEGGDVEGGDDEEDEEEGGDDEKDEEEGGDDEKDEEEGGDGFANNVEPYSGFEGFEGVEDLYEGQDNQEEEENDICSLFNKMESHDDCKKIKGKGTYMIRKHCKKCMK